MTPGSAVPSEGESYEPAEVPRRDVVPPSGFSPPGDVTSDPEGTELIPPFRARRRRIAFLITVGTVTVLGAIGIRLAYWTLDTPLEERRPGIMPFLQLVGLTVMAAFGVRQAWRWAMAPHPAERLHHF